MIAFLLFVFFLMSSDRMVPIEPEGLKNFHVVTPTVYRSGQPHKKDMKRLEQIGVKTIINLRNVIDDKQEIKGTSLIQLRIPMRAKKITYEDIVTTMCAIETAEKPVLIHCLHGSDRTGCMVAAYQMLSGMKKEEAISQFQEEQYGYNSRLFPNILELLESIDPKQLKIDVGSHQ